MGHVDRIARTDIDFLQYRLLYNGLLSEAGCIHAIYEEASSWVGVFPPIYSHIGHKKDIEEGKNANRAHSNDKGSSFTKACPVNKL